MLHLLFYWLLALMLFVGLLAGCAGLNAAGTGVGMGWTPYQPYLAPAVFNTPRSQRCIMQQDPIGGIGGPTLRMSCY